MFNTFNNILDRFSSYMQPCVFLPTTTTVDKTHWLGSSTNFKVSEQIYFVHFVLKKP